METAHFASDPARYACRECISCTSTQLKDHLRSTEKLITSIQGSVAVKIQREPQRVIPNNLGNIYSVTHLCEQPLPPTLKIWYLQTFKHGKSKN